LGFMYGKAGSLLNDFHRFYCVLAEGGM
jgi:hypothetical protein